MEKINIGFDADGVLFDTELFQLSKTIIEYMKKTYNLEVVNENGYRIKEIFNCSEEAELECWKHIIVKYSLFYKARPWIKETIKMLRQEGHKVYIITSKACALEKNINGVGVRLLFELGLKFNGIYVDGIEYCDLKNSAKAKEEACKKRNIRIMVEDNKENIAHLSQTIPVLCVDTLNNKGEKFGANVTRVQDGNDIYANIKRLISVITGEENIFKSCNLKTKEEKKNLSIEERNVYYNRLIEYYKNLPYNHKKTAQSELAIRIIAKIVSEFFDRKYKPIVIGKENLPKERGMIYVCNHLCDKDMLLLLCELRGYLYQWRPLIKQEVLDETVGILFRIAQSVFVKRNEQKSRHLSTQEMAKHLVHNHNILIFPEGTYNRTKNNLKDFTGTSHVYLSQVLQKPIVTMALTKDYNQSPVLRIEEPYVVSRSISLDEAQEYSYQILDNLVEQNRRLLRKGE